WLRAMSDVADTILGQRLSQISGVGRVAILGGLKPAVRVQADLARLAAYGISMEDLRSAIAGANVSGPKGSLDGAQQAYTIAANDQIAVAEAYKPIIIAYRNGSPVTIGDIAISLDNLSLMALTIGTGFVVDDAIVMIENIVRHMEDGETVMEASLKGASEIGFTVISLTVSLIAVFIPLLFMSGLVGRMFREFALTLTIAVVTSAIVSLTLTPMMCSRLLKHAGEEMAIPGLAAVTRFIDGMVDRKSVV